MLSSAPIAVDASPESPGAVETVADAPRLLVVGLRRSDWWSTFDHSAFEGFDVHRIPTDTVGGHSLDCRVDASRQLVAKHGGVAVLWVEEGSDAYHVYVVRPFETALYWTSVSIERTARPASHARLHRRLASVAEAIRTDDRLPMERLDLDDDEPPAWRSLPIATLHSLAPTEEPEAPPPVRSESPERGTLRLAAAYAGTTFARSPAWQSGLALEAGWVTRPGAMIEVGYTAYQRVAVPLPDRVLELVRHPVHFGLGYELELDRWLLGFNGTFIVDVTERTDWRSTAGDLHRDRRLSTGFAVAPRGRVGFAATERIEVFTMLTAELWLRTVEYRVPVELGRSRLVFASHRARATPTAGLAFRL